MTEATPRSELPNALREGDRFWAALAGREVVIFSDYDGVLSPIMPTPDQAVMAAGMRQAVEAVAAATTLAVVSGRDLADVRSKVAVDGIYYAGSHGFDIVGPDGEPAGGELSDRFDRYLEPLRSATAAVERGLDGVDGAMVEHKRFATAIHYRNVARSAVARVEEVVRDVATSYPELTVTTGKEIFEYRPDFDWDKGRALEWLIDEIGIELSRQAPVYLGDDTTDEDAFRAVRSRGAGVVVGLDGPPTLAAFALADAGEVETFLARVAEREADRG